MIENVPVAIMPDDKMRFLISDKKEFKIDFLLGANLLKEFRTEMDFRRKQLISTKGSTVTLRNISGLREIVEH